MCVVLQKGALQAYKLGVRLRERYRSLLPKNGFYSTNEMYVMSSATERCLMTAQSFLAGFLPPNDDDQRHLLPIKWQPVAINSVPRENDRVHHFFFLQSKRIFFLFLIKFILLIFVFYLI